MLTGIRPRRKAEFQEYPLSHLVVMGGMLILLFLEGVFIVSRLGWGHIIVLLVLWLASFPLIQFSLCRKCFYYGKRCPVPGEGNLAHILFDKKAGGTGLFNWMGAVLTYAMRLGYPVIFLLLYPERYSILVSVIYALTFVIFLLILVNVVGCPNCMNTDCPMNPDNLKSGAGL
jgi:hypothetical protein